MIAAGLVVIEAVVGQPHLARVLHPPGVAWARLAVGVVGEGGGDGARRVGPGDHRALSVLQREGGRGRASAGVDHSPFVGGGARHIALQHRAGAVIDRRQLRAVVLEPAGVRAGHLIQPVQRIVAQRRARRPRQPVGGVIGEGFRAVVGQVALGAPGQGRAAHSGVLVQAVVDIGGRAQGRDVVVEGVRTGAPFDLVRGRPAGSG
ncbi:hypothetical protein D3C80_978240 [compost metagenome]